MMNGRSASRILAIVLFTFGFACSRASGIDTLDLDSVPTSSGHGIRKVVVKGCVLGDPSGNLILVCGEKRKANCMGATLNRERMRKGRKWFMESTVGRCGLFRGRMAHDKQGMRMLDLTPELSQTLVLVDSRQKPSCNDSAERKR